MDIGQGLPFKQKLHLLLLNCKENKYNKKIIFNQDQCHQLVTKLPHFTALLLNLFYLPLLNHMIPIMPTHAPLRLFFLSSTISSKYRPVISFFYIICGEWVIILLLPIKIFLDIIWLQAQIFQIHVTQVYNSKTCNMQNNIDKEFNYLRWNHK